MREVLLIRHGVTDWNATGRFQGRSDVTLSSTGRSQAAALATRLTRLPPFDGVYTSPLLRAAETARLALPAASIEQDSRLQEIDFGLFEGRTLAENQTHPAWALWYADPYSRAAPGGESYGALRDRAVAWLLELPDTGRFVAFCHSGTIQMLLSYVVGVERPRWRKRFFLHHTSLSRILFESGEAVVERVNDAHHLRHEATDPFND